MLLVIGFLSECYCENSGASQYTILKALNEYRLYMLKNLHYKINK